MAFYKEGSQLFEEWLKLAGDGVTPVSVPPLSKDDALIVIDMQADFVPKDSLSNPYGGRFGVAEGANVIPLINSLVDSAVNAGATICATRDYHPHDHCSFFTAGGPFPPHCLQGSMGSHFHPRIGAKLTQALRQVGPDQMLVAFKAFHECIDSFGAFPYHDGGDGRLTKGPTGLDCALGRSLGCAKAPFTGSVILKQSDLVADGAVNINAPPDVLAVTEDGVDRKLRTLHDVVKDKKRVFVCGLALDFCVMDTCLNALGSGLKEVYMVLDAARAAHIPNVGSHGSGFLSSPSEVVSKLGSAGVRVVDTASLAGVSADELRENLLEPAAKAFPAVLAPLGLTTAEVECKLLEDDRFHLALTGRLASLSLSESTGKCSPCAKLPVSWPGAPPEAVEICFTHPIVSSATAAESLQKNFLAVSASPELCFVAYGGFLLLGEGRKVVAAQAVTVDTDAAKLSFGEPRKWREAYTDVLKSTGRFQPVTLPSLLRQGASEFTWVNPKEDLVAGPEHWTPSETGCFVYLMADAPPVYFPVEAEQPKPMLRLAEVLREDFGSATANDEQKVQALLCKLGCEANEVETLLKSFSQERPDKKFDVGSFLAWMWSE